MVSGTSWPGGDPFLRQQNEGTVASLTRNPCHLLGGANDYRSVDIPFPFGVEEVTGDAWLGVFKSFDCGQRWQSTLLPGYPQDESPEGLASPLKGFEAGADPVVIATHNGMAYYIGLVFDRDRRKSAIFSARFLDLNNKEGASFEIESNGDPIKYLDAELVTKVGNPGRFYDRPWVIADIPRAGAEEVTFEVPVDDSATVSQSFACGNVYVSYAVFLGGGTDVHTNLYVARSTDCGSTWREKKVSQSNRVNNGATMGIDRSTGDLYVAWRRFASEEELDAIVIAKSTDGGQHFSPAQVVHTLNPPAFEQGTTAISFRATATPSMAVGSDGRVYLAWSEEVGPAGEGRIVLTASGDGGQTWSAPTAVDDSPLRLGHQFFPTLLFHQGRLALLYYGQDLDHTRGVLECQNPDPTQCVDTTDLAEVRQPLGHLDVPFEPERVFNQCIAEVGFDDPSCDIAAGYDPLLRRHTVDVYLAMSSGLDPEPAFGVPLPVSQYLFGQRDSLEDPLAEFPPVIEQFEFNPPNLPMFLDGSVPFFSDYIFLAGAPPMFANPDGSWSFNDVAGSPLVLHAVWTDNRNVRPPPAGLSWSDYVPPRSPDFPSNRPSVFDPGQMVPDCDQVDPLSVFRTAMRNQDLYTSKITEGLFTGSLQTSKPLGIVPHPDPSVGGDVVMQRSFVMFVQNATEQIRHYRLSILNTPPGGTASFDQFDPTLVELGISAAPLSTVSRTVFVTSPLDPTSRVTVDVTEIADPNDLLSVVPDGLHGEVVFNADPSTPDIGTPDIGTPDIGTIANAEVYNPDIGTPDIGTPDIGTPDIGNPDIGTPDIGTPDIGTPDIGNPDIGTPDIGTPDIGTPDVGNPDIGTPDIGTADLANGSLVDATWTMTNLGNTSAAYDVDLFQTSAPPGGIETQMILHKVYKTPTSFGCSLVEKDHNVLVANITDPTFATDPADVGEPDPTNPDIRNATIALAPGEAGKLTIRFLVPNSLVPAGSTAVDLIEDFVTTSLVPVTVAQSVNTVDALAGGTSPPVAVPLSVTTTALPDGSIGTPYSEFIGVTGGVAPYTFSVASGLFPPGLSIDPVTGEIFGVPTVSGNYDFSIGVTDDLGEFDTQALSMTVIGPVVTVFTQPTNTTTGVPIAPAVIVEVTDETGSPLAGLAVDMALAANPSGASLGGGIAAFTNGVGQATFGGLTLDQGGFGFTLEASIDLGFAVVNGRSDPFNVVGLSQPGSMSAGRAEIAATRLQDGKVLIAGGLSGGVRVATAEIFDPLSDSFASTGSMAGIRSFHTQTLLPDGTVLVTGGQDDFGFGNGLDTVEVFDPVSGTFGPGPNLSSERSLHTATRLRDGTVLVVGGLDNVPSVLATAEIYDPSTGLFTPTGSMTFARWDHEAVRLHDGRVLVAGGSFNDTAEIYDPSTGLWTVTGSMSTNRGAFAAVALVDGTVLVAGGVENGVTLLDTAEIWDSSSGTFTTTVGTLGNTLDFHTLTALPDGQALVTGGFSGGDLAAVEIFDPTTGLFTPTTSLVTARSNHTATLLLDGRVMVAGGGTGITGVEIYHPDVPFSPFARIVPADTAPGDRFAIIDSSGDTVLGEAVLDDDACPADPDCDSGSAYLFERDAGGPNNFGQTAKIIAPDGAAGDLFGIRQHIDGDTVVIAAVNDDDACPADPDCDSGSVYVYGRDEGGPDNWGLVRKITASDQQYQAGFGSVIALDGDTLIVGASGVNQAYVYERDVGGPDNWGEVAIIVPPDVEPTVDAFGGGFSIGLVGDNVAIDNVTDSDICPIFGSECWSGSVYVFERNLGGPDNWGYRTEIHADDVSDFDLFGIDVSLSGDTLAVGAYLDDDACPADIFGCNSGSAYIFERDAGGVDNWGQVKKITASEAQVTDWFGLTLGLLGDALAVSSRVEAGSGAGAFYLFARNQGGADNWGQVAKVTSPDADPPNFGGPRLGDTFMTIANSRADDACPGDPACDSGVGYVYLVPPF